LEDHNISAVTPTGVQYCNCVSVTTYMHVSLQNDETPLHLALERGNVQTVELLLDSEADINARNKVFCDSTLNLCIYIASTISKTLFFVLSLPT